MTMQSDSSVKPWYREFWPWALMLLPFTSIVLGINLLFLSLQTNNSLVVDDYYKQGKAINISYARDKKAAAFGLEATLLQDIGGIVLSLTGENSFEWPESVELRWVHTINATQDGSAILLRKGQHQFVADGVTIPADNFWRLHIESPDDKSWRLVSEKTKVVSYQPLIIQAGH